MIEGLFITPLLGVMDPRKQKIFTPPGVTDHFNALLLSIYSLVPLPIPYIYQLSAASKQSSMTTSLPREFFDAHHHFLDTQTNGESFQAFLGSLVPNEVYLSPDYHRDVVRNLSEAGIEVVGSTHLECMPNDGVAEAQWIAQMENDTTTTVQAIVASADLASSSVDETLKSLQQSSLKVRGIRWILDCVGKFNGKTATHVATTRHDGVDYLRGSEGGYDGEVVASFERGFALLEKYNFTFDLQCAPAQLPAAARLCARYPKIQVVIDHLGKPRMLLGADGDSSAVPDAEELEMWRAGMKAMAALPHVHVKLSMLGYAVPGWIRNKSRLQLVKSLVRETVHLFGPSRCMIATNFWKNQAVSDSDGLSDVGPEPRRLLELLNDFLNDYPLTDRQLIFCGTAKKFYKVH